MDSGSGIKDDLKIWMKQGLVKKYNVGNENAESASSNKQNPQASNVADKKLNRFLRRKKRNSLKT